MNLCQREPFMSTTGLSWTLRRSPASLQLSSARCPVSFIGRTSLSAPLWLMVSSSPLLTLLPVYLLSLSSAPQLWPLPLLQPNLWLQLVPCSPEVRGSLGSSHHWTPATPTNVHSFVFKVFGRHGSTQARMAGLWLLRPGMTRMNTWPHIAPDVHDSSLLHTGRAKMQPATSTPVTTAPPSSR